MVGCFIDLNAFSSDFNHLVYAAHKWQYFHSRHEVCYPVCSPALSAMSISRKIISIVAICQHFRRL